MPVTEANLRYIAEDLEATLLYVHDVLAAANPPMSFADALPMYEFAPGSGCGECGLSPWCREGLPDGSPRPACGSGRVYRLRPEFCHHEVFEEPVIYHQEQTVALECSQCRRVAMLPMTAVAASREGGVERLARVILRGEFHHGRVEQGVQR